MPLSAWIAFLKLYQACVVNVKQGSERFCANFLELICLLRRVWLELNCYQIIAK